LSPPLCRPLQCAFRYHTYCLAPPLDAIPEGDWFCPDCIAAANHAEDLGFNTGKTFTVAEFEAHCAAFDARFFGAEDKKAKDQNKETSRQRPSIAVIEEHFWRMVEEGGGDAVDVHYGADVDTSAHGSAFPRVWDLDHGARDAAKDAAATHPWNLNNVPRHPKPGTGPGGVLSSADDVTDADDDGEHRSLLRRVHDHIPGVLVPWLYFGSTFSSFCWHFEDHALYSMNYNHLGAAKTWYGVPGASADDFEQSFKKAMPDLFASQPDLLFQLVTMLSPSLLQKDGVPVFRTDQHAGEFVVTFPRSYHAGFNTGFNVAEAVNFAPPDWLRFGRDGVERYRDYRKPSVLCHDELLCVAAADAPMGPETAKWLLGDLKRTVADERAAREELIANGVVRSRRYTPKKLAAKAAAAAGALELRREAMAGGRKEKKSSGAKPIAPSGPEDPHDAAERVLPNENANGAYDRECTICRYILHLSGVACTCNPDRPACLRHSAELCDCPNSRRVLFYRKSIAQLEQLVKGVERACGGKKQKSSQSADASAKARQKKAAAWAKEAKAVLAQKSPPPAPEALEKMLVASEEFTWAGEDMDDVRKVAHLVSIAIAFQRELAVLKRRIDAAGDAGDAASEPITWSEPAVDDADIVVAAAAGAPVRVRRGGKYVDRETEQEAAARRAAESEAAAAAEAKVNKAVELSVKETEREEKDSKDSKETASKETPERAAPTVAPPRRMTLRRLRELLDAAPYPVPDADAAAFAAALAAGEDLEARVASVLAERPHPNPKKCISLAAETTRGPLEVTSARRLRETVAAAHAWSERVRKTLPGKRHRNRAELPNAADLAALRADAAELPVQPNDLSALDAALEETETWREKSRALLDADVFGTERFSLERAEKLLEEGETLPVACDEVDAVAAAVAAAKAWDEEAEKADEADAKLDALKRLLRRARRAKGDTSADASADPPLLLVLPEEVDALEERIRVREWADPAKRVAAGKPTAATLAEIRELVAAGAAILEGAGAGAGPAEKEKEKEKDKKRGGRKKGRASRSPPAPPPPVAVRDDHVKDFERQLLERLRASVVAGEAWEAKASSALAEAEKGSLPALEDVERLVKEASGISATLEGFDSLAVAAGEARKWAEKAQSCLKGKQLTRRGANAPAPTLAHAERLVRDAGKFSVCVRELSSLRERVAEAKAWGEKAETAVETWREVGALDAFAEIMADHDRFGLELPAAVDVRACVAALEWEREARDALEASDDAIDQDENETAKPSLSVLEDLRLRLEDLDADVLEEMEAVLVEEVKRRLDLCDAWTARVDALRGGFGSEKSGVAQETRETTRESARVGVLSGDARAVGSGSGVASAAFGSGDQLSRQGGGLASGGFSSKAKPVSAERAAAEAKALAGKRPTPEAVRALVEEGKNLPVSCPRVAELEATLEEHFAWVEAARELLGPPPPEPTAEELAAAATSAAAAASADAAALEEALAAERRRAAKSSKKGKKKGGKKSGGDGGVGDGGGGGGSDDVAAEGETDDAAERARVARRAKSILAAVESKLEKRRAPDFVDARPAMSAVLEMLSALDASMPLRSEEGAALAATAAGAVAWSERLRRTLVRPRSSAGAHAAAVEDTKTALHVVVQSIRAAIADLEGTGEPPESEEGQFCLCRQPGGKEMIGCDECGDWYHLRCVQVTANFARTAKHYVCPACRASAPDGDVFEINKPETTHRHIHRTRRASLATLGEALLESISFRGRPEEEDLLVQVFETHKKWRDAVAEAKSRRAKVAEIETKTQFAKREWEEAEAKAAVPRNARLERAKGVRDRAAAVQQAQVLAGATAMAAALLGAGGGGTAAAALEATQRCATLPPEQQLDALGQQVAAAAAIKQQQLMQLKGAVAAAAAAGLAGGDASQESVAAAADSAGPFEALLIAQLQELGTFVHQLATSQQHIQAQLAAASGTQDLAAQQYQVVIQVMMLQQHYVALSKQQDVQLETLGSGLLEQQRVVAAAAAAAMEQDEEDDPTAVEAETPNEEAPKEEAPEPVEAAADAVAAPEEERNEEEKAAAEASPTPAPAADADKTEGAVAAPAPEPAFSPAEPKAEPKAEPPEPKAEPLPVPAEDTTRDDAAVFAADVPAAEKETEKEKEAPAPRPVARRKKAPEQASEEELALAAAATAAKAAYDEAAAVLAEATRPSPARQMLAGLKSALAMELEHDPSDPELPILLREVCGAAWRARAEKTLAPALALGAFFEPDFATVAAASSDSSVFPTLGVLTRLRETGVASGMIVPGLEGEAPDALGEKVYRLERLGQKWLDRAADAVDKRNDVPVDAVKALMAEGKALPINLKEELEELGERCEVYCVCETAYDATRPMISCDNCEGWFHYECCDMRPPTPDEPEDEGARFTCPPCCEKNGATYAPFRPPPDRAAAPPPPKEKEKEKEEASEEASEEEDASKEKPAKPAKPAAEAPAEPDAAPAPSGRGARRSRRG
jgi:hypothetical protein